MRTLKEIVEKEFIKTDKHRGGLFKNGHTYMEVYDELFSDFRNEPINILEIGVLDGASIELWWHAFPNAKIYGFDKFTRGKKDRVMVDDRISLYTGDSVNDWDKSIKQRNEFFKDIGDSLFHIIIDDGDHQPKSQLKTFNNFKHILHPDGKYVIEDIWDWDRHNKKCKCEETGLEFLKNNISKLNIYDMNDGKTRFNDNILGVYDGS